MTSAEIIVRFINGRPDAAAEMRKRMTDPFKAPEIRPTLARELVFAELKDVTESERALLDEMRGNSNVDWLEVANAFG